MEPFGSDIMEEDASENCSIHSDNNFNSENRENQPNDSFLIQKSQTNLQPIVEEMSTEAAKNRGDDILIFQTSPFDENAACCSKSNIVKKRQPFTISQREIVPRLSKSKAYELIKKMVKTGFVSGKKSSNSNPKKKRLRRRAVQKKKKALRVYEKRPCKARPKTGYHRKPATGQGCLGSLVIKPSCSGFSFLSSSTSGSQLD